MRQSPIWKRDEKALLVVSVIVVILGVAAIQSVRRLNDLPTLVIPTPTLPSPNAFDFFNRASAGVKDDAKMNYAIVATHPTPPTTPDDHPYSQADKEALVAENASVFATLRQGFAYPYVNPPARSFSTLFPYYAKERNLARLLTLESQAQAGRGDWGGAVGSNLDAVQLGEMVPHGGVLIGSLVGIACEAIGRRPIWRTYTHLNASQAQAAARRLQSLSAQEVSFADTMQEEEWMGQAGLLETLRAPDWRRQVASLLSTGGSGGYSKVVEAQLMFTPKRRILDNYTRYMNQAIAEARKPYTAAPTMPPVPGDPVSQMLLPVFSPARLKATDNRTQDALLATTLALWAYQQEHGKYPATLGALVPDLLSAAPDDPFAASGPLHYRLAGTGYLLYSVGPDGKDDGGTAVLDSSKTAPTVPGATDQRRFTNADSRGDIVAGVNMY